MMKLKPCPYCGSERIWSVRSLTDKLYKYGYECADCHARVSLSITKKGAWIKWQIMKKKYIPRHY